jgi:hypothetical protein
LVGLIKIKIMERKNLKSIFILLILVFVNCKSPNENKIIGNWVGTNTNKAFSNIEPRYCEMEFTEEGKFFNINSDIQRLEKNKAVLNDYIIKGDSLITIDSDSRKDHYFIEYISDTKLILREKVGDLNDFSYELNKVGNK